MALLTVALQLESPLLVGAPRQGNAYQSYSYLPGSVLRGAVAAALMAGWSADEKRIPHPGQCDDPATCSFCQALYPHDPDGNPLSPPIFHDCYPALQGAGLSQPFPHTARTCKRHAGFIRPEDDTPRHGVMDTLIRQAAAKDMDTLICQAAAKDAEAATPYVYELICPECGEALKTPEEGYYGRLDARYYAPRPINRRFSRTAINRKRQTAQDRQLFTLTVMGEQMKTDMVGKGSPETAVTRLAGLVETGNADAGLLRDALKGIRWLGSGGSRGLGEVAQVRVANAPPERGQTVTAADFQRQVANGRFTLPAKANPRDLGVRLVVFNQIVQQERAFYKALGCQTALPGRWYFSIDLLSDTFVADKGLPTLKLTADMLRLHGATLDFMAAAPVDRGGWVNAWGLPRPRQVGIQAGGVYLFRVDSAESDIIAPLFTRLQELEATGLGADRERGAGLIQVCAPFHQEVTSQ
ncbi:MAG: hypothetical protein GY803_14770 [Chloroflexi bacterium]|nr:hypothetical protein [Chloroflexota bacterium]